MPWSGHADHFRLSPRSLSLAFGQEQVLESNSPVQVPALSLGSCVSLGKFFNFSVPPFPQVLKGDDKFLPCRDVWEGSKPTPGRNFDGAPSVSGV